MTSSEYHVDAATKYARPARFPIRIPPLTVAPGKDEQLTLKKMEEREEKNGGEW